MYSYLTDCTSTRSESNSRDLFLYQGGNPELNWSHNVTHVTKTTEESSSRSWPKYRLFPSTLWITSDPVTINDSTSAIQSISKNTHASAHQHNINTTSSTTDHRPLIQSFHSLHHQTLLEGIYSFFEQQCPISKLSLFSHGR